MLEYFAPKRLMVYALSLVLGIAFNFGIWALLGARLASVDTVYQILNVILLALIFLFPLDALLKTGIFK